MQLSRSHILLLLSATLLVNAQANCGPEWADFCETPSTFPHAYPGMPKTPFGTEWQKYFEVTDTLLPNLTNPLPRSFAGNVGVNRRGHPNATLFFWAVEKSNGSLTTEAKSQDSDPWMLWLNGGPGSSSLLGFFAENGPIRATDKLSPNEYSWSKLADTIWVDQPVGVGFATSDSESFVRDEDQMAEDFLGFFANLVKIFPSLARRPLYLFGESYGGVYVPFIVKALFSTPNPPVHLKKIIIADGAMASKAVYNELSTTYILQTYPQLIDYDPEVFKYFQHQEELCGYNLTLTYPQNELFPTLKAPIAPSNGGAIPPIARSRALLVSALNSPASAPPSQRTLERWETRHSPSPSPSLKLARTTTLTHPRRTTAVNETDTGIDPWYGCDIFRSMWDYALNFTFPWTLGGGSVYNIPDAGTNGFEAFRTAGGFLLRPEVVAALHAPTSVSWAPSVIYPFKNNRTDVNEFGDPSIEPMIFLSELFANASTHGVGIVIYSGNDDSIVAPRGTEVTIQNTTWGGIQGFTRKPATAFTDDAGRFVGIVHQERGLTYARFAHAGHEVPEYDPVGAFTFVRDFVFGGNATGLVLPDGSVVGGEDPKLAVDVLPGDAYIRYDPPDGTGSSSLSTAWPSATVQMWEEFIVTATATATRTGVATG
ncbi:Carboxypeptidase [Mycena kentingensis (nom. inval.)]|nr:Carboxypeptidase [Mycena kentingensis (nom. inval.)]